MNGRNPDEIVLANQPPLANAALMASHHGENPSIQPTDRRI